MSELVAVADIITPNPTEAAILLKEDYPTAPLRNSEAKSWLVRLAGARSKIVVITSCPLLLTVVCQRLDMIRKTAAFGKLKTIMCLLAIPGSGDMFASVLTGGILNGDSLPIAMNRATSFTELAVKTTHSYEVLHGQTA